MIVYFFKIIYELGLKIFKLIINIKKYDCYFLKKYLEFGEKKEYFYWYVYK